MHYLAVVLVLFVLMLGSAPATAQTTGMQCAVDLDGDGYVDSSGESAACQPTSDGIGLCPIGATACTPPPQICPIPDPQFPTPCDAGQCEGAGICSPEPDPPDVCSIPDTLNPGPCQDGNCRAPGVCQQNPPPPPTCPIDPALACNANSECSQAQACEQFDLLGIPLWSCTLSGNTNYYTTPGQCASACQVVAQCTQANPSYSCASPDPGYQVVPGLPASFSDLQSCQSQCEIQAPCAPGTPQYLCAAPDSSSRLAPGVLPVYDTENACATDCRVVADCVDDGDYTCPTDPALGCYDDGTGTQQCSPNACVDLDDSPPTNEPYVPSEYQDDGPRDDEGVCQAQLVIFSGVSAQCRRSGTQTQFRSCCLESELSQCTDEERDYESRAEGGNCTLVGERCIEDWPLVGCVQRSRTYCCFNSKLGRIIQEQGRLQLQQFNLDAPFGTASSPDCRGFTPEEFQMLDFSRLDLSEYFGDLNPAAQSTIQNTVSEGVNEFESNVR